MSDDSMGEKEVLNTLAKRVHGILSDYARIFYLLSLPSTLLQINGTSNCNYSSLVTHLFNTSSNNQASTFGEYHSKIPSFFSALPLPLKMYTTEPPYEISCCSSVSVVVESAHIRFLYLL